MLNMIVSIFAVIITILFIIGFHELGHFLTARCLGIKVLRFSIGFGKKIFSWHDKKGTEYAVSALPLGGYVKMLDETEGVVAPSEQHLAFNRQPLYKKCLVIAAGPLFNFILAIGLYWILFWVGFDSMVPLIGKIEPHSIAAEAGLKPGEDIVSINNKPTTSWTGVVIQLLNYVGDSGQLTMTTKSHHSSTQQTYTLDLTRWKLDKLKPDPISSLGITPYEPVIPNVIGRIEKNSSADLAGLQLGDKITAINGQPMINWIDIVTEVSKHPNDRLSFTIQRQHQQLIIPVSIQSKRKGFHDTYGYAGMAPAFTLPPDLIYRNQYTLAPALHHAIRDTLNFVQLNFVMLGKMITGKVSLYSLSGPITIFQGAGVSLHTGMLPFLSFIAFISVAIGVINIIPIPGLDGGHLMIYLIESIIRRPIPARAQELMFRLGFIVLIVLAIQAVANDVMRL